MNMQSMNNKGNPYRFNDPDLVKVVPTPPKVYGKFLMYWRLFCLVSIALILMPLYLLIFRLGNLFGWRNAGFPILRFWGHIALWACGLRAKVYGDRLKKRGVIVANHVSPADTLVLFATFGGYMMPKAEVRSWPVIGFFTKLSGAQFLVRERGKASLAVKEMHNRLCAGDQMVFHPEATTTDGQRLLHFRSTLFAALVDLEVEAYVQPVTIVYHAPKGASANFYGWWGFLGLFEYLSQISTLPGSRIVEVHFGKPIAVQADRYALAKQAEEAVAEKLKERLEANGVEWLGSGHRISHAQEQQNQ